MTYHLGWQTMDATPPGRTLVPFAALVSCALFTVLARAEDRRETSVGMVARIDQIVLPGTELEARPLDDRAKPVVLRIVSVYPHGTDFRYDLAYYVLDPGTFDLKDYLRRRDSSSTADLPPLLVTARPLLRAKDPRPVSGRGGPAGLQTPPGFHRHPRGSGCLA